MFKPVKTAENSKDFWGYVKEYMIPQTPTKGK